MRVRRGKGAQVRTSEEEKEHRYEHQKRNCPEAERVASAEAVQRDLLLVLDDFHLKVGRSSEEHYKCRRELTSPELILKPIPH